MMRTIVLVLMLLPISIRAGTMINPVTDVCWECVFPMTVSGVNVTPGFDDYVSYSKPICVCGGVPPKVGVPVTFWEPAHLVDVTRHAYKLIGLGGISVGSESVKNRGAVSVVGDGPSRSSFYHVHFYEFPILQILSLFSDFDCITKGELDVFYMSEFDPLWNDDNLSLIVNGEAALFASPVAQLACIADCASASANKPLDELFWCAGCEGSLYPLSGTVGHHVGAVQASALITHRIIAKMHRMSLQLGYEKDEFCQAKLMPIIKKSLYKTQLVHPIPQTSGQCHPLGQSDIIWGSRKSYPKSGEDFVYLIWKKKQCCLDALKPAVTGGL